MRKFLIVINKFLALLFYDDIKYIILKNNLRNVILISLFFYIFKIVINC